MAHPAHRSTRTHRRNRASHHALEKLQLTNCAKCKAPAMPHRACKSCGTYAGRQVHKMDDPTAKSSK